MAASLLLGGAIRLAIFTVSGVLFSYFSSPRKGVGGIPTIPFWVALMPLVKDVDQQDVFTKYIEKPLRKHGAASVIFAGQWNVLIHKPAYLAEVFRREDIYQKSGNYSKIPRGVLAALLGDNIISSHGELWKKYKRVMKPGLQARSKPGCAASKCQTVKYHSRRVAGSADRRYSGKYPEAHHCLLRKHVL